MTQPQQPPPVDPGNRLLAEMPAVLTVSHAATPAGARLVATIRTPSATLTVFLDKTAAHNWANVIKHEAQQMSGAGLIAANGRLPSAKGRG